MTVQDVLGRRLTPRLPGRLDVVSQLRHFALINYAVPVERLAPHIPGDRFAIAEFVIDGERRAMVSAVPFLDVDFTFPRVPGFPKLSFAQTNYRAYVIDRATGEHAVWFFGTTLGDPIVQVPRVLWRLPWHRARYAVDCQYDAAAGRYARYRFEADSDWGPATMSLEDTGVPLSAQPGFASLEEMRLILTHPLEGYFYRLDGRLGTYSVWHELMAPTMGRAASLYFGVFERLGVLSREEMGRPHSVFMLPETTFQVILPPRAL